MDIQTTSAITVRLIQQMGGDHAIVAAAKVSTSGQAALQWADPERAKEAYGLINFLMKMRHGTPFECSALTFFVHAPTFVWWQWTRHRIGHSYNLESSRYHELEPVFWIPGRERKLIPVEGFKPARPQFRRATDKEFQDIINHLYWGYVNSWEQYQRLLEAGTASEVARAVLGFGVYFSGWVTVNPRSLLHFISLRTHEPEAAFVSYPQAEIEEAARCCEEFLKQGWPLTWQSYQANGRVAP